MVTWLKKKKSKLFLMDTLYLILPGGHGQYISVSQSSETSQKTTADLSLTCRHLYSPCPSWVLCDVSPGCLQCPPHCSVIAIIPPCKSIIHSKHKADRVCFLLKSLQSSPIVWKNHMQSLRLAIWLPQDLQSYILDPTEQRTLYAIL